MTSLRRAIPLAFIAVVSQSRAAGTFEEFAGTAGAASSAITAVNADGTVFAGSSSSSGPVATVVALRLTAPDSFVQLGILPGMRLSSPTGISADGSVIVGTSSHPVALRWRAFRWTAAGGLTDLGGLNGGDESFAHAVSANGNVVVGRARDGAPFGPVRAYRWTEATGMVSLGLLSGGALSEAFGVNADGSVVVGHSTVASTQTHAFRWTQTDGMSDLGTLPGMGASTANAVDGSGTIVVGTSYPLDGNSVLTTGSRAFRWTPQTGMQSLGTLNGGTLSYGKAISADGSTIVGYATDGAAGNVQRAFRWTSGDGLQKVEDWLRTNGVAMTADVTATAEAVNADGTVVVGTMAGNKGYIARVSSMGNGLVTLESLASGLAAAGGTIGQSASVSGLALHGLRGNPLAAVLPAKGTNCIRLAGDAGLDDHGARDGSLALVELAVCRRLTSGTQVALGLGTFRSRQGTANAMRSVIEGQYGTVEAIVPLASERLWLTVTGMYQSGDLETRRHYINAGNNDSSFGRSEISGYGVRLRLDWKNLVQWGTTEVSPYFEVSRVRTGRDAYAEAGGGFPAAYFAQHSNATEARLGTAWKRTLGKGSDLWITLESAHRFERDDARTTGQVIGLFAFDVPGADITRNWLRIGSTLQTEVAGGRASIGINATTRGTAPNAWVNLSYQRAF